MERTLLLGVGVAIGVGVSAIVQRLIARRSVRPLRMRSAVPPSQLCPSEFEEPSTDDRLLRRIETVVQRRTARIVLVLERLQDGHNYAAVLRTCESLGVQHVWIVSPPKRDDLFETAARRGRENNVEFAKKQVEKEARRDERPGDLRPTEGSKRQRRVARRARVWEETDALDGEHIAFAKKAARFLTVRTLDSTQECLAALAAEGREVWATDLGQAAEVLAPGAAWLGVPGALPEKLALIIGTESTGVSREMLAAAARTVYLPQNGFADSLNASVSAALALHTLLGLYGERACGDLAREAPPAEVDQLRRAWAHQLARDEAQATRLEAEIDCGGARPLDDLRRHDAFREHTGRLQHKEKRAARRAEEQEQHTLKVPPWQCPSSVPAPSQGAPGGSGWLETPVYAE